MCPVMRRELREFRESAAIYCYTDGERERYDVTLSGFFFVALLLYCQHQSRFVFFLLFMKATSVMRVVLTRRTCGKIISPFASISAHCQFF